MNPRSWNVLAWALLGGAIGGGLLTLIPHGWEGFVGGMIGGGIAANWAEKRTRPKT